MSTVISVEIGDERHVYTEDDLPLSVGGRDCHLGLTGLAGDGPLAYLGHDRGELFIQPAENGVTEALVTCNGVPLTASRWLGDGDEVGIGQHRLRCEIAETTVRLALVPPASAGAAIPAAGISPPLQTGPREPAIAPIDFQPRWQSPPRRSRFKIRPLSLALMAISIVSMMFFSSRCRHSIITGEV